MSTDRGSPSYPDGRGCHNPPREEECRWNRRNSPSWSGRWRNCTDASKKSPKRELDELFARKDSFKNGAEALQAFRDLFDSDEEMEEFGLYLQQMREEERARYRD